MDDRQLLQNCIRRILDWYPGVRRALPWRDEPTPYRVWISEIMLQQTRIEAVIPYYARFLAELPELADLAAADEDRLLKLWEGLGYYSRARNLKKAAQGVMAEYGGELPRSAAALKRLPGIGDYTAGAIASIAWGEPEPAVDGNVLRVLTRVLANGADILQTKTRAALTALLREQYPAGKDAGLLTEGLMELGETVCVPSGAPDCAACPLAALCRAHRSGTEERYPVKSPPKPRRIEERTILLLCCSGRWAIRRRADKGLLAGLWEFPSVEGWLSAEEAEAAARALGGRVLSCTPCASARHVFTHVEWHMRGWRIELEGETEGLVWRSAAEIRGSYSIPTALRAYQKILD